MTPLRLSTFREELVGFPAFPRQDHNGVHTLAVGSCLTPAAPSPGSSSASAGVGLHVLTDAPMALHSLWGWDGGAVGVGVTQEAAVDPVRVTYDLWLAAHPASMGGLVLRGASHHKRVRPPAFQPPHHPNHRAAACVGCVGWGLRGLCGLCGVGVAWVPSPACEL